MTSTVEIKNCKQNRIPKALNCQCLVCNKKLNAIVTLTTSNAEVYPSVSGGVVFRSSGQYGSTILDCGVGIPTPFETEVQIIICDECLLKKSKIVNTRKNKRAVIVRGSYRDSVAEWSDYSSFKEMLDTQKADAKEWREQRREQKRAEKSREN